MKFNVRHGICVEDPVAEVGSSWLTMLRTSARIAGRALPRWSDGGPVVRV